MVNQNPETLNLIFSALSDPTRRAIIERLAQGEVTVTELAAPFNEDMSLPAVSRHLRVLENAGILQRRIEGRVHHLSLKATGMQSAALWLETYRVFWDDSLDALAKLVEDDMEDEA
jgi:DNA-binding transcriptional ArsR family regulator